MSIIHGTAVIRGGQIIPTGPINLPEGTEVQLTTRTAEDDLEERERDFPPGHPWAGLRFMTEEEWSDDPEEIRKWIEDLESDEPLPEDPVEEEKAREWEAKMRAYNIEAVRRQFEEGAP